MPRKTESNKAQKDQVRLALGVVLKPPVGLEDLKSATEYDPQGAEEFVEMIRTLRKEGSRPLAL